MSCSTLRVGAESLTTAMLDADAEACCLQRLLLTQVSCWFIGDVLSRAAAAATSDGLKTKARRKML